MTARRYFIEVEKRFRSAAVGVQALSAVAGRLAEYALREALDRAPKFNQRLYRKMLFYRRKKQLSRRDTAKLLDVSLETVEHWEGFVERFVHNVLKGDPGSAGVLSAGKGAA